MAQLSLTAIQRMITFEAVSPVAAINLINCLWNLMESGVEELKLLQTVTLLISTNNVVHGDALAKGLALCFRLHFTKNQTTNNTASATIRQIVSVIFERTQKEDIDAAAVAASNMSDASSISSANLEELKQGSRYPPKSLSQSAGDAFLLFQDLVQLVNADQPFWLNGLTEMTRTFGLELLESIFIHFPEIFFKHEEFCFLLKERVCPLVIKLFSPNIKYKPQFGSHQPTNSPQVASQQTQTAAQSSLVSSDKPFYPISMRLLRIVTVLTQKFYSMLITESEIFLSLLIKFLDGEKPSWQRAVALEVLHKICIQPNLLRSFCLFYDMKPHSSKIFRDIVVALGVYTQSQFISPPITPSLLSSLISAASSASSTNSTSPNQNQNTPNTPPVSIPGSHVTPQAAFLFRGTWIPILFTLKTGQTKGYFLEQLDKLDVPLIPEGYGLTTAYHCLLEVVRCVVQLVEGEASSDLETITVGTNGLNISSNNGIPSAHKTRDRVNSLKNLDSESRALHEALLSSSWCGLLASFSVLLESSTDEGVTETILKHMEKLVSLYGLYGLAAPRDAFVIAMCKSSLPSGYNLPSLTFKIPNGSEVSTPDLTPAESLSNGSNHSRSSSMDMSYAVSGNMTTLSANAAVLQQQMQQNTNTGSYLSGAPPVESSEMRQQVVAVGTALPTNQVTSTPQGPVMLTAKNLQCMRAVLTVAHCHGRVLDNSWHVILTTLQHLVWILGLKPSAGGSLKAARPGTEAGASTTALITTAAMSDLPVLSAMLSRLFESSQELDEAGLIHLVDALCKLSSDAMELAYNNREPSLFAVAKILETGLVNVDRIDIIWRPLTAHLLDVSRHPHVKMREWGAEAVTSLVRNVLTSKAANKNKYEYLIPLQELSRIPHPDIRQKQIDTCLQMLQSSGDVLGDGWPQVLDIVGAINESQNENLVRLSFQCMQLIISDFLPSIPPSSLTLVVDSTARFGSQLQELNVSLTAIGSLWNIADFLYQNQEKLRQSLSSENGSSDDTVDVPPFETLWMSLFARLGDLCTDSRPSIRKSASQTLFSALANHGTVLEAKCWHAILWQVLFPLLERVRSLSTAASSDKITDVPKSMGMTGVGVSGVSGSILLHHSRNTAQKQWSETQVLTLSGACRIFSLKREQFLSTMVDFEKAWALLHNYIESASMSRNPEVSISALKCFQEILCVSPTANDGDSSTEELRSKLWMSAWTVWYNIGAATTKPPTSEDIVDLSAINKVGASESPSTFNIPSQAFLTSLIQIFPFLFAQVKAKFSCADYQKLSHVVEGALAVPVDVSTQAYLMSAAAHANEQSQHQQSPLTPLQEAVLFVIETLTNEVLSLVNATDGDSSGRLEPLLSSVFSELLTFSTYASQSPSYGVVSAASFSKLNATIDWTALSYVPLGERSMRLAVNLYQQVALTKSVINGHILQAIVKALKIPLCRKYSSPSQTTWKLAVNCLLSVLQVGLPVARQHAPEFVSIWADLANTLEGFLFPTSRAAATQTLEEQQIDEALDVKVVELIRDSILPYAGQMPKEFVLQVVSILNKGSIHSTTSGSPVDTDLTRKLREEFARTCFETLLQFSFLGPKGNPNLFIQSPGSGPSSNALEVGLVNKLAVTSLLQRFHEVVVRYLEDEKLSGKCPLARHRVAEISFVLKALATLIASLKKAPKETVESGVWFQLIALYPHLVDCTTSNCAQVNRSLREVLYEYKDLLCPPGHYVATKSDKNISFANGS